MLIPRGGWLLTRNYASPPHALSPIGDPVITTPAQSHLRVRGRKGTIAITRSTSPQETRVMEIYPFIPTGTSITRSLPCRRSVEIRHPIARLVTPETPDPMGLAE